MSLERTQSQTESESKINLQEYEQKSFNNYLYLSAFDGFATLLFMLSILFSEGNVKIFSFGFWAILSTFGGISGAHLNPAVTLGFYVTFGNWGLWGLLKMLLYVLFQFLGCFIAAGIKFGVVGKEQGAFAINGKCTTELCAFFGEFFYTGTFFFVISICTHPKYAPSKIGAINCAIIIAWFYSACEEGANLSGSAYNPAVLITIAIMNTFDHKVTQLITYKILGELLGVVVFGFIYKFIYCPGLEWVIKKNQMKKNMTLNKESLTGKNRSLTHDSSISLDRPSQELKEKFSLNDA